MKMLPERKIFLRAIFCATINNSFTGSTYIRVRGKAQLASSIAAEHYRMYPLPEVQRMKVNHANFNQQYVVYTNQAAQASLILTGSMLDHMLLIKTKLEKDIVFRL